MGVGEDEVGEEGATTHKCPQKENRFSSTQKNPGGTAWEGVLERFKRNKGGKAKTNTLA